jgi:hypothetical protein
MTSCQFFQTGRTRPACLVVVLMFLLTTLLLVAGCESEDQTAAVPSTTTPAPIKTIATRHVTTTIPTTEITPEPEPVTEIPTEEPAITSEPTIAVSGNYHQEYIKMDSTTYAVGEVVQFYLVNKGHEIAGCNYAHPPYTVYHLSPAGIRLPVATGDPARSYMTVISDPDSATGPFSLDTHKLSAGRYIIRFDCGNNVSREFVIMSRAEVIAT